MNAVLSRHDYGKSGVRLTRVTRLADSHEIREIPVDVRLEGEFESSYTLGDNSQVIATDTMKNVVYALAQGRPAEAVEEFASALAGHFLDGFPQVRSATVRTAEQPWRRITVGGREHPHAFVGGGGETRTAAVTRRDRGRRPGRRGPGRVASAQDHRIGLLGVRPRPLHDPAGDVGPDLRHRGPGPLDLCGGGRGEL